MGRDIPMYISTDLDPDMDMDTDEDKDYVHVQTDFHVQE
jgi:sporulation-control protein spo0M